MTGSATGDTRERLIAAAADLIAASPGEDFSLGRYHEAVLSTGSVPVRHLPGLVRPALGL